MHDNADQLLPNVRDEDMASPVRNRVAMTALDRAVINNGVFLCLC
jgi:hypothetical protein